MSVNRYDEKDRNGDLVKLVAVVSTNFLHVCAHYSQASSCVVHEEGTHYKLEHLDVGKDRRSFSDRIIQLYA